MKKKALICNSLIIILELIGLIAYIIQMKSLSLEYYTMESNVLALITSSLFLIFREKKKFLVADLRFITTCCLTVTFLVVLFILLPMSGFNFYFMFFQNETWIFHFLVPIVSIISYICFEERSNKQYLGFLFTLFYAIVLIILNLKDVIVGPYPFLRVKEQSILMSIIWCIIIIGGSYVIGLGLNYFNKKIKGAQK